MTRVRFARAIPGGTLWLAAALLCAAVSPARVQAQIQVEVDPIAYALNGYSLHGAKVMGRWQFDVGVFGIDIPKSFHGNDGWSASTRGAGVKLDFAGEELGGFFAGVTADYGRSRYTQDATRESETRGSVGVGVRGGYRLPVGGRGLYLAPWLGVGYGSDGRDVAIAGERYRMSHLQVFPTVHLGWRF